MVKSHATRNQVKNSLMECGMYVAATCEGRWRSVRVRCMARGGCIRLNFILYLYSNNVDSPISPSIYGIESVIPYNTMT